MTAPSERIEVEGGVVTACHYPAQALSLDATLVLAHGAGGNQTAPFMLAFARGLASQGLDVTTFNFLYAEQKRRMPDARPRLEGCFRAVIDAIRASARGSHLFAGGKSMGGRIATHLAAADGSIPLTGLVLLGYPLHPPGRPDQRRDEHLPAVKRPMLFVQGSRDPFGTPSELEPVLRTLQPPARLHVVEGGDHSFKVRGAAVSQEDIHRAVLDAIAGWVRDLALRAPGQAS
jgi:predicted alpha/beta-hydrolase family hydrolase